MIWRWTNELVLLRQVSASVSSLISHVISHQLADILSRSHIIYSSTSTTLQIYEWVIIITEVSQQKIHRISHHYIVYTRPQTRLSHYFLNKIQYKFFCFNLLINRINHIQIQLSVFWTWSNAVSLSAMWLHTYLMMAVHNINFDTFANSKW